MSKTNQFFNIFKQLFNRNLKKQWQEQTDLKCVLKKLNHKKRQVLASLDRIENAEEKAHHLRELRIIHAQRLKGIHMIKEIKIRTRQL